MTQYLDNIWSAATSYGLALFGLISPDDIMFILGAVLLVVRLMYETIRLYRYIRKGEAGDD